MANEDAPGGSVISLTFVDTNDQGAVDSGQPFDYLTCAGTEYPHTGQESSGLATVDVPITALRIASFIRNQLVTSDNG